MRLQRRKTRRLMLGSVAVGGGAAVSVQSMTTTDTRDPAATGEQIRALARAGCDIVRVAVPDREAVAALPAICAESPLPVVADIHFDSRLAIGAVQAGVHGLRINPGNIGDAEAVRCVARACAEAGIPIRVGVNAGSLAPELLQRHGCATPEAMVESALAQCRLLEDAGCDRLKVSLKASSVRLTVAACRAFAAVCDYPLHLGVTEAGSLLPCAVKSAMGIGALLLDGIGDTIRVSLTGDPVQEVEIALQILRALDLRHDRPEVISCPTCGRTEIDLVAIAGRVEEELHALHRAGRRVALRKIAVMGCVVNGPGEARDADVGIAGGRGKGALFRKGQVVRSLPEDELVAALLNEIRAAADAAT